MNWSDRQFLRERKQRMRGEASAYTHDGFAVVAGVSLLALIPLALMAGMTGAGQCV